MKNRGMMLESLINKTIKYYDQNNIALFHKKEIPISFSKIKKNNGKINIINAKIKNKSTIDYYGIYNGTFYAFEAKSTKLNSLPIKNIKEHQINYLNKIIKYGGKGFLIVAFQKYDEYFVIKNELIKNLKNKSLNIKIARKNGIQLEIIYPGILDFLNILQ
jgi:recombination protein U